MHHQLRGIPSVLLASGALFCSSPADHGQFCTRQVRIIEPFLQQLLERLFDRPIETFRLFERFGKELQPILVRLVRLLLLGLFRGRQC